MQRTSHPHLYALERAATGRRRQQTIRARLQLLLLIGLAGLGWLVLGGCLPEPAKPAPESTRPLLSRTAWYDPEV